MNKSVFSPSSYARNKNIRAFSTSSLPLGLMKEWDDHVMDMLEYSDEYIDPDLLVEIGTRIYKEGASINIMERDDNYSFSGIYVGKDNLEDLIYNCPTCRLNKNSNVNVKTSFKNSIKNYGIAKPSSSGSITNTITSHRSGLKCKQGITGQNSKSKRAFSSEGEGDISFNSGKLHIFDNKDQKDSYKNFSWKNNVKSVYFLLTDFTKVGFINSMKQRLVINNVYSVLVKVELYDSDEGIVYFRMVGSQLGIHYTSYQDFDDILSEKFDVIKDRLIAMLSHYNADKVNLIQVMYITNNSLAKLRLKNINKVILDKGIVSVKQTKLNFSENFLPLSVNEIYYGELLRFDVDNTGMFVSSIHGLDFIKLWRSVLESQNKPFSEFSVNTRFYHYIIKDKEYIITVKDIDENKSIKDVYNMSGYKILDNVIDLKLGKNSFIREINDSKFHFYNNKVVNKEFRVKFPILKLKYSKYKGMANPNIGSFDIETYLDKDSKSKVYALGFTTLEKLKNNQVSMYYLGVEAKTSDELIIKCLDDMLSVRNRDHIYYTHNLGGYDIIFILAALRNVNSKKGFDYYIIDTLLRDSKVLKAVVKVKTASGYSKISFVDSYNLLTDSLDNLSKSFGSKTKKGLLPYSFIKYDTLNYKGNTPAIEFYKTKNKTIELDEYKILYKNNWCLKTETLKYLEQDLRSLLEIMDTFNSYIFIEYNIQVTECLTISRLALNIYLKKYLGDTLLPVISQVNVFSHIKEAYYGGIAEVYKPWGRDLLYYDVNSLYPFVSKNVMPGHLCTYIENVKTLDLSELFGFYYCKVKSKDSYLGLLPVHKDGLIMPNGEWYGWYFSEELKFAKNNGYEITVFKGYTFNKVSNVFDKYVDDIFKIKASSEGSTKLMNKYLLNSLLGRFGMSITKLKTEMVSMDKYTEILSTKPVNSAISISDTHMLVSYSNIISKQITKEHGLDYLEILNNKSSIDMEKLHSFDDVAVSISAAITAYARIHISKIKLYILNKGGKIYYSDTDSIVTDLNLPTNLVGNGLGLFKLEYKIKEAYFITAKTYCLVLEDEYKTKQNKGVIIKSKGVFDNSLSLSKFKEMYFNKKNITAIKSDSKVNYKEGYVNIDTKEVTLRFDSYLKREKLYDKAGLWVDTRPLIYTDKPRNSKSISPKLNLTLFKPIDLNLIPFVIYITPYTIASSDISKLSPSQSLVLFSSTHLR